MLDITSAKNGNVQHSFSFLVHGFQPHSSNIPPGHHSGSNPHSQAGQQLHAAGVHVEFADSFIALHNRVLSAYGSSDKVLDTQPSGRSRSLSGQGPSILLAQDRSAA